MHSTGKREMPIGEKLWEVEEQLIPDTDVEGNADRGLLPETGEDLTGNLGSTWEGETEAKETGLIQQKR